MLGNDMLMAWDAAVTLGSGLLLALAYRAALETELFRLCCIGAALAPMLLRQAGRTVPRPSLGYIGSRMLVLIAIVSAISALTHTITQVPATWLGAWCVSGTGCAMVGRHVLARGARLLAAEQVVRDRVAVIGEGADAEWLRATFAQASSVGVDVVRSIRGAFDAAHIERLTADLVECGRRGDLDRVVLALAGAGAAHAADIAHRLKAVQVEVASLYPLSGPGDKIATTQIADVPLFLLARRPQCGWGELGKAAMDRCLALCILIWISPILALIALAIRLDSAGPILFRQRRHGVNGTEFEILKFRSMRWQGSGAGSGEVQTRRCDSRVTRVGGFLRKTSLDEVPQLLNVLNGTMSLVGPRPHPVVMKTENRLGEEITAEYAHRQRVKPGITGWAQVHGYRGATDTAEQLRKRIEYDNHYIENWSLFLDMKIILKTPPIAVLFSRSNAF